MEAFDSDDSLDLPDLFEKDSSETETPSQISPGTIVWAEFRNLYWPALVRTVYRKEKKVSVWYLDSPGKSFKLPWKRIKSFENKHISVLIRKQASQSPLKEKHEKVLLQTLSFIRRQACGCNDNPLQFFDSSIPYLSFKNLEHCTSSEIVTDNTKCEDLDSLQSQLKCDRNSDDEISDDYDEDEMLAPFTVVDCKPDASDIDAELEDNIVMCIKSGNVNKHLLAVQSGRVSSEYHNIYLESLHSNRKKLWNINPCEKVRDLNKLRDICGYLMDLYEKSVEGGKCVMHRYITAVWIPEAIEKAVSFLVEEKVPKSVSSAKRNLMTCENSLKEKNSTMNKNQKKTLRKSTKTTVIGNKSKIPSLTKKNNQLSSTLYCKKLRSSTSPIKKSRVPTGLENP